MQKTLGFIKQVIYYLSCDLKKGEFVLPVFIGCYKYGLSFSSTEKSVSLIVPLISRARTAELSVFGLIQVLVDYLFPKSVAICPRFACKGVKA